MKDFLFCQSGCQGVRFADGTQGFLDPADGTYYDSQGNDVTGYVQNFGGATVLGPASPADVVAAEGLPPTVVRQPSPMQLPPGPSPRVSVPLTTKSAGMFMTSDSLVKGVPTWMLIAGGAVAFMALSSMGGGRRR
jgi:hypothetical protein